MRKAGKGGKAQKVGNFSQRPFFGLKEADGQFGASIIDKMREGGAGGGKGLQ